MRKRVLAGIAAVAAGILIGMPVCAQEEPISDGVFIGDKNVSGMMPDEAAQYVKNEVATLGSTTVTITMGSQQTSATFRELGFSWENTDLVDEISQIGTKWKYHRAAIKSRKICRMKAHIMRLNIRWMRAWRQSL